ncbi:Iron-sulfur cluster regulator IscR [Candidatus Syntrophocurvum alkaliphilum]|uniref:Iron-sulfur cluster regulator IscR n=1 Tax=Candidatus Syntrophocurvum alkaliphilum TaxID=2293317 RepID=A0A6I6DAH9_9FIRM|nr:Rrf2 family transcriptional regulator [Candidatus Syntrophocurvum alkaliphilum]QGT99379.1 Iron-sulfur cluster regulator IscR [Candidatus Syntrophocurvum alkaliphilum]
MKFSTKSRYGLRAMIEIASNENNDPIPSKTIAQRQDLSVRYLEQLLLPLKQAGLLKSIRGSQGGYILGKKPSEITVLDIIRVLEGPIAPVDCVNESSPEKCNRFESCVTKNIWYKVRDCVTDILNSYTLKDLLNEQKSIKF